MGCLANKGELNPSFVTTTKEHVALRSPRLDSFERDAQRRRFRFGLMSVRIRSRTNHPSSRAASKRSRSWLDSSMTDVPWITSLARLPSVI